MNVKMIPAIIAALIIGFLGGVGAVQMTMGSEVRESTTRINRIEKDIDTERLRTDQRIFEIAGLCKEIIAANREQMGVMKTQNELLRQLSSRTVRTN